MSVELDPTRVDLSYMNAEGVEAYCPLAESLLVKFEDLSPARKIRSYKGQRHFPGQWWSVTTGAHVGYESWLERDHLIMLDFDPKIIGITSQPFWLHWGNDNGRKVRHIPDFFARMTNGDGVVIDCRPDDRRKPHDLAKFEAAELACGTIGWEYRLVGSLDRIVVSNVRWLAGYRHPRHRIDRIASLLLETFSIPTPVFEGAAAIGDLIEVLPVLYHLLWLQELLINLSVPFSANSFVSQPGA